MSSGNCFGHSRKDDAIAAKLPINSNPDRPAPPDLNLTHQECTYHAGLDAPRSQQHQNSSSIGFNELCETFEAVWYPMASIRRSSFLARVADPRLRINFGSQKGAE